MCAPTTWRRSPLRELLSRNPGLDPAAIDDVIFGCANQAGEDNRNVAHMATLLAGYPHTVPGTTINRLCGSGLDAIGFAARAIKAGDADLLIAGGVESMSRAPFVMGKASTPYQRQAELFDTTIGWRFVNPLMAQHFGTDSMPETAENVAELLNISRADQDAFAWRSQQRTAQAQRDGILAQEIVPVQIVGRKGAVSDVREDEHPRPETTLEQLAKLKSAVPPGRRHYCGQCFRRQRWRRGADHRQRTAGRYPGAHAAGAYRGDGDGGCRTAPDGTGAGTGGA
ncbi:acetyl-CoA acetyltransferase [Klebsiella pneumoniae]|uniref:Acetyl-CoA acetyltransferase n=1 Tax=Klebsiella pneumoniae TaxID=573 RepID=A0A2X3IQX5_KLEPN|nr:acetyl-CoA acetyltransferase [Klebsiella pneumoniae]